VLKNNLLTILRNFKKFRLTFGINLICLSVGLTCGLLIYLWVSDEMSVDKFHKNSRRLYQLLENRSLDGNVVTAPSSPGHMAENLAKEIPEVEHAVTVRPIFDALLTIDDKNFRASGMWASTDYFSMFSYLVQGDSSNVLSEPKNIVISESLAQKMFGSIDVIGRDLEFQHKKVYKVSGVFNVPSNSSEQFDFALSYEEIKKEEWLNNWQVTATYTYLLLRDGASEENLNNKLINYIKEKTKGEINHRVPFVQKYSDRYLYGNFENGKQNGGRIEYVKIFSWIAVFIMLISCVNFINLTTARVVPRMKEIGVKKTLGATRFDLIMQFIMESTVMAGIASVVAFIFVYLLLPSFNEFTEKTLVLAHDFSTLFIFLLFVIVTGLIAGSYPAFYLSAFRPASTLRAQEQPASGGLFRGNTFRTLLVVFQFTVSTALIVFTLIAYQQVDFIQSKNHGYDINNVLYFYREGGLDDDNKISTFLEQCRLIPGVEKVANSSSRLIGHQRGSWALIWDGKDPNDRTEFELAFVEYDVMETLDIKIKSGRSFSREYSLDTGKVIFNEAAIRHMELKNPIGQNVIIEGHTVQIVGVAADFNYETIHKTINPLAFVFRPMGNSLVMVKLDNRRIHDAIAGIEKVFNKFAPGFPFEYTFMEERYQKQYKNESRVLTLSKIFGFFSIGISCLGLFGLATFSSEQRMKEIVIRKIHGATESSIVAMLTFYFAKIVLLSVLIAVPISYMAANNWLKSFAYKIDLDWWLFAGTSFAVLIVTFLTVGLQTLKAAKKNPLELLKSN